jgi:hypothetical protein
MAFTDIKPIRLSIDDPSGVIDLLEVDVLGDLPTDPLPQVAYRVASTGIYFRPTVYTGATVEDYEMIELLISDSTLNTLNEQLGQAKAVCRAFGLIARKLGAESRIVRNTTGAESTEYAKVMELYSYYKALADDCAAQNASDTGVSTGRYGSMKQPDIAGGVL